MKHSLPEPDTSAGRSFPLVPALGLLAVLVVSSAVTKALPAAGMARILASLGLLALLFPARRRPAGKFTGGYMILWVLISIGIGAAADVGGVVSALVLGFFCRRSLSPWVKSQPSWQLVLLGLSWVGLPWLASLSNRGSALATVAGMLNAPAAAWMLLAGLRAWSELTRRVVRRAPIRYKLILAFGLLALTPALLAILFLGMGTWLGAAAFRATVMEHELEARSVFHEWVGRMQKGAAPRGAAELGSKLAGAQFLFEEPGRAAVVLERRPSGWTATGVGGPAGLWTPATAPLSDSSRVVRGLILRAGGFYWTETALWPNGGDTLCLMTFEPVDTTVMNSFARALRCDLLITGPATVVTTGNSVTISVRDSGDTQEQEQLRTLSTSRAERDSAKKALLQSMLKHQVTVGGGKFARNTDLKRSGQGSSPGLLHCTNWSGGRWQQGVAMAMLRYNILEQLGLKGAERNDASIIIRVLLLVVGVLFLVVEIVSLVLGSRVSGFITRGVNNLRQAALEVGQGNFQARVTVPSEDEFGELADTFNKMAAGLEHGRQAILEREQLRRELELARRIQARLLPASPPLVTGFELAATNAMSQQVGGDYYDFVEMPDGRVGLCIADVSGKGVGAALLMSNVKAALVSSAGVDREPGAIASRVNRLLSVSIEPGKFVTFFFAALDPVTMRLDYVNAGHPAPMLLRAGGAMERLDVGGLILGIDADAKYDSGSVVIGRGDLLALFTDGVDEAQGDGDELYGEERIEALLRVERTHGAEEIMKRLVAAVKSYEGGRGQSDDLTVMVLKAT